ncbi:non-ribosomal peptide synthetase [Fluviispira multicolorata]|uniref:AMP-binding protein n=1 Tax=Fluviispira multicolorata TaxID=2654512 RepID=A0A833JCK1_9BACT|nr:AMP-binding protein [Fluviispira multicolorata]KAB8030778.1 AMP-binding protein [Fluviispira multicolorata]
MFTMLSPSLNPVWNKKDFNSEMTILDVFHRASLKKSSELLIEFNDQFLTAHSFWQRVLQKSHCLQNIFKKHLLRDIFPGECIAISSSRSLETLSDMLAILFAGGAFVPYDLQSPKERVDYVLNNANVKVKLNHGIAYLTECNLKISLLHTIDEIKYEDPEYYLENMTSHVHPNQLAYIMYTSGSSGQPKGVKISHRALWHYCTWFGSFDFIHKCERIDFSTNLTFDASITTTLVALAFGKTISVCSDDIKNFPSVFLQYLIQKKINLCKCTPSYFRLLVNESKSLFQKIPQTMNWLFTGEEMSVKDSAMWLELHPHHVLYNSYGPTEATVTCSKFKIDRNNIKHFTTNIPIEKDSRACSFHIVNNKMQSVPHGVKGELCLEGPILADGYLNKTEETQKSFVHGKSNSFWYRTGDEVMSTPDGHIYYFGRLDSQVKIRGIRVELEEIRFVICSLNNVLDAKIIVHNKQNAPKIFAFIVVKQSISNESIFCEKIKHELLNKIPMPIVPQHFVILKKLPINIAGKTDIQALHILAASYSLAVKKKLVTNPLEMSLLQIWKESLPPNKMGIDTNFFDLGGHSLLAMLVMDKINRHLNTSLPPSMLFQKPTIRELGQAIFNTQVNHNLHHLCHNKNAPVLFLIHPATGLAHLYQELKSSLKEIDFYALSNDRFGDVQNPYASIEEMAASYIQILRKHCPKGPYILGGFCTGGVVAFEMIKQLESLAITPCALVLIDSFKLQSLGSPQERDLYNKTQLHLRGLPENSQLGQKIVHELNHNQVMVVNYHQKYLTSPCLFIECKHLHSEVQQESTLQQLKKQNHGWSLPPARTFVTKSEIDAFHHTLFSDAMAVRKMGEDILQFCITFSKN